MYVVNSTISGNEATSLGGGGFCNFNPATTDLRNTTITKNKALGTIIAGGGFHNTGIAILGNTIVAGNTSETGDEQEINFISGTITSLDGNLVGDDPGDSASTGNPITYANDILDTSPQLIALGNYGGSTPTHPFQYGSPVTDSGALNVAVDSYDQIPLITDQRGNGFSRFVGNEVDIGAFEAQEELRFYVTQTADAPAGGACDQDCALREAVAQVAVDSGATIEFARSIDSATPIVLTFGAISLVNTGTLSIKGHGAENVLIEPGFGGSIFIVGNGTVEISGVTIRLGLALVGSLSGGGIQVASGSLTLRDVHLFNNFGDAGGGVNYAGGSNHSIINSIVSGNQASNCSGIRNAGTTLTIVNSTIAFNNLGGGNGSGGAICSLGGTTTLRNTTIFNNTAARGGGIHLAGGTLDMANSILAGNNASGSNPPEINLASGTFTSSGNNLIGDSAGDAANTLNPVTYQASDILDSAPLLGPLQNNGGRTATFALLIGSPAIDAGDNAKAVNPLDNSPLFLDQRGFLRFIGLSPPIVDIGAFEFGSANTFSAPTPTGSNVNSILGPVSVSFAGVTQAGNSYVTAIDPAAAGTLPSGFTLGPGFPAFDVSTTAVFTAPVAVCFQVPTVTVVADFNALKIIHYENGVPFDRTASRDFLTKTICASVSSLSPFIVAQQLSPTSVSVSVSGRVMTTNGTGLSNAVLHLTNQKGANMQARTNSFGYFRFESVLAGETYVIAVSSKEYQFQPQVVSVFDEINNLNFTPQKVECSLGFLAIRKTGEPNIDKKAELCSENVTFWDIDP